MPCCDRASSAWWAWIQPTACGFQRTGCRARSATRGAGAAACTRRCLAPLLPSPPPARGASRAVPPRSPTPARPRPQYDNGAQVVQIFDSWAAQLSPQDFDVFCAPYIKHIIAEAKKVGACCGGWLVWVQQACGCARAPHTRTAAEARTWAAGTAGHRPAPWRSRLAAVRPPAIVLSPATPILPTAPLQQCPGLPIILYISNSGALVERMAACQPGAWRGTCRGCCAHAVLAGDGAGLRQRHVGGAHGGLPAGRAAGVPAARLLGAGVADGAPPTPGGRRDPCPPTRLWHPIWHPSRLHLCPSLLILCLQTSSACATPWT